MRLPAPRITRAGSLGKSTLWLLIWICVGGLSVAHGQGEDKQILLTLEVAPDPRGAIGSQQKWMAALQQVGADRVVSQTRGAAAAAIEEKETETTITIRVRGFLERDKLVLPGGKFSVRDVAGIRDLLKQFRDDGAEITLSEKKAFGLTAKQLVWVHAKLSAPVEFETRGRPAKEVVDQITQLIDLELIRVPAAEAALERSETVADELNGLSAGTALAAALRPLGLVLQPNQPQGKSLRLEIRDFGSSEEHWPVGWPSEEVPVRTEPRMFEKMPIQISNFPLDQVLKAVQKKAKVPFLLDYNTMARKGIVLAEVKVTANDASISLSRLLSDLLRQTRPRMSHELRIDERGTPFVWISSR